MGEYFCPYCGDELTSQKEIEVQDRYYKENGICSHWDTNNKLDEF